MPVRPPWIIEDCNEISEALLVRLSRLTPLSLLARLPRDGTACNGSEPSPLDVAELLPENLPTIAPCGVVGPLFEEFAELLVVLLAVPGFLLFSRTSMPCCNSAH